MAKTSRKTVGIITSKKRGKVVFRFFSNASDVFFDKQGRIQVPLRLTKKLDFNKEVVIIGVGNRLELWDKEKWNDFCSDEGENSYEQLAELIADMGLPL